MASSGEITVLSNVSLESQADVVYRTINIPNTVNQTYTLQLNRGQLGNLPSFTPTTSEAQSISVPYGTEYTISYNPSEGYYGGGTQSGVIGYNNINITHNAASRIYYTLSVTMQVGIAAQVQIVRLHHDGTYNDYDASFSVSLPYGTAWSVEVFSKNAAQYNCGIVVGGATSGTLYGNASITVTAPTIHTYSLYVASATNENIRVTMNTNVLNNLWWHLTGGANESGWNTANGIEWCITRCGSEIAYRGTATAGTEILYMSFSRDNLPSWIDMVAGAWVYPATDWSMNENFWTGFNAQRMSPRIMYTTTDSPDANHVRVDLTGEGYRLPSNLYALWIGWVFQAGLTTNGETNWHHSGVYCPNWTFQVATTNYWLTPCYGDYFSTEVTANPHYINPTINISSGTITGDCALSGGTSSLDSHIVYVSPCGGSWLNVYRTDNWTIVPSGTYFTHGAQLYVEYGNASHYVGTSCNYSNGSYISVDNDMTISTSGSYLDSHTVNLTAVYNSDCYGGYGIIRHSPWVGISSGEWFTHGAWVRFYVYRKGNDAAYTYGTPTLVINGSAVSMAWTDDGYWYYDTPVNDTINAYFDGSKSINYYYVYHGTTYNQSYRILINGGDVTGWRRDACTVGPYPYGTTWYMQYSADGATEQYAFGASGDVSGTVTGYTAIGDKSASVSTRQYTITFVRNPNCGFQLNDASGNAVKYVARGDGYDYYTGPYGTYYLYAYDLAGGYTINSFDGV